jgi:hypothetical protein
MRDSVIVKAGNANMPLALDRSGVISKKCDRSNHKPDTNNACTR